MLRIVYALLVGLFGAILVHLGVLFLLPDTSSKAAWAMVPAIHPAGTFSELDGDPESGTGLAVEPGFRLAVCPYDLADGALRAFGSGHVPFWSVAVHSSDGAVLFAANDRNLTLRQLDLVVVDGAQLRAIRQQLPEDLVNAVIIDTVVDTGFVVVRVFEPDSSFKPSSDAFLRGLECVYENY